MADNKTDLTHVKVPIATIMQKLTEGMADMAKNTSLKLDLVKMNDGEDLRIDLSKSKNVEKDAWSHICLANSMDGIGCGKYTTHRNKSEKAVYIHKVRH